MGGDGLPNCGAAVGSTVSYSVLLHASYHAKSNLQSQCHIPLTATVTNPANGKSVIVQIVDRCVGCAVDDIDMTITAFKAIADEADGRVSGIEWKFNKF